jgi:hypothetical protein
MARLARQKSEQAAFYHLFNRVAGDPTDYPFQEHASARRRFLSLFEFYLRLYFCRLASFQLMGNHYHCVIYFEALRLLTREELKERARRRFGRLWRLKTRHWSRSRWERLNRQLFDVSCFMQHVNGEFAKWFNRRYARRGPFWADRFKNPQLLDTEALQSVILYTELNAVRAGLVKRPEDYRWGSAYWRWAAKKTDLLIPLEELFPPEGEMDSYQIYRALLYHRGAVAREPTQGMIPQALRRREQERGFARAGILRRRLRFLTDGIAVGGREPVRALLERYREEGLYRRRKNPIPQLGGVLFSLREQRSHAFSPG